MSVLNWRCWQHLETKYPNLYALIFWWVSSAVIYWKVEWHRQKAKGGILSWVSSDVVLLCYIKLIAVVTWLMMSVAWYYVIVIANTAHDLSTEQNKKEYKENVFVLNRFVLLYTFCIIQMRNSWHTFWYSFCIKRNALFTIANTININMKMMDQIYQ